jgi:hypothetical protein
MLPPPELYHSPGNSPTMEIKSIARIVGLALVLATTSTQLVFAHGTQTHINIHNNIHCPNNLNVGISGNTCTAVGSTGSTNIHNNIHCPNNLNVGISGNTCTAVGS